MPRDSILFAGAITLLVISAGLMIGGAALDYQDGLGAGSALSQFGRLLLIGGGAAAIWYFKWGNSQRGRQERKSTKPTLGMYALGIIATILLVVTTQLQRQSTSYAENDRLWLLIAAVLPVILAALVVAFFLVRYHLKQQQNKKVRRPNNRAKS
jgi:hypothetical protein